MKTRNLLIILLLVLGASLLFMVPAGADDPNPCCPPPGWPPPPLDPPPGTGTPGYWKNHPDDWPVPRLVLGCKCTEPPVTWVCLFDETRVTLIQWMETSVEGDNDKTYTMLSALVAAALNRRIGNPYSCINWPIVKAVEWLEQNPVGSGVEASSDAWQDWEWVYETLDDYSNGELCAPPRDVSSPSF